MLLKTYSFLAVLFITCGVYSQDLKSRWEHIDSLFKSENYSEVAINLESFIPEIQNLNSPKNLIVAYYYYGVASFKLQNYSLSDSLFQVAKEIAIKENLESVFKEILTTQIQQYSELADKVKEEDAAFAKENFNLALRYAVELADTSFQKNLLLHLATLHKKEKKYNSAIELFNNLYKLIIESKDDDEKLFVYVVTNLNELHISMKNYSLLIKDERTNSFLIGLVLTEALKEESKRNLVVALQLFDLIREEAITSSPMTQAVEYSKKRFDLHYKLDEIDRGIALLKEDTYDLLKRSNEIDPAVLNLEKILIVVYLKKGNVDSAFAELTLLESLLAERTDGEIFYPHFLQLRGDISYIIGDYEEAINYFIECINAQNNYSQAELFSVYNNLGLAYLKSGKLNESLNAFQKVVSVKSEQKSITIKINAILNEGLVYIKMEDFNLALISFKDARTLSKSYNLQNLELIASLRMAEVYQLQGYEKIAKETFDEVKRNFISLNDVNQKIQLAIALAGYEKNSGSFNEAEYFLGAALKLADANNLTGIKKQIIPPLADLFLLQGNADSALAYYIKYKDLIQHNISDRESFFLELKIAKCLYSLNRFADARKRITTLINNLVNSPDEDVLSIKISDKDDIYLFGIGLTELSAIYFSEGLVGNNLEKIFMSHKIIKRAVDLIESSILAHIIEQKKESGNEKFIEAYRLYVDVSIEIYRRTHDKDYLISSFEVSEKFRSQNYINDYGTNLIAKMNNPKFNQTTELASYFDNTDHYDATLTLASNDDIINETETRGIKITKDTTKSFTALQAKYDQLIDELKIYDTKAAELLSATALSLQAIRNLLKDDEIILNYFVSKEQIHLFVIGKEIFDLIPINVDEHNLREIVQSFRKDLQAPKLNTYFESSEKFYELFMKDAETHLAGKKIIIIPSGQLNNIPFSSLITENSYLIEKNEIVVLPNISSLQFFKVSPQLNNSSKILAIGNPKVEYLSQLPGAENEVNQLKKYFLNSEVLTQSKAKESYIKSKIENYQIVHFACHGLFNYDYPLLSALALTGDEYEDGRLELYELYNLNLMNTKLVVLSACETALSQIKRNDEMIGLVRGFLYAGASVVVASLWKVDDEATSKLMTQFYIYLTQGFSISESLRKAQLDLANSEKFSHPFYWAAFVLNGIER